MSEPTVSDPPSPPTAVPCRLQLPHEVRGFIGHTESLGQTWASVREALSAHPAFLPGSWGSAYADDPWPRPLPADLPPSTRALLQQRHAAQRPDRPRTVTFATRESRSLVSLEDHEGALVLAIAYGEDAVPPGESVRPSAAAAGGPTSLPAELPADVRAALGGLSFASAATLVERLLSPRPGRSGPDDRVTTLLGLAAVWHDDLRLAEILRHLATSPAGDWALRAAGIAVAQRQGYRLLLHELAAGETDPELSAELAALLSVSGIASAEEDSE
jgi:hypothetical protein